METRSENFLNIVSKHLFTILCTLGYILKTGNQNEIHHTLMFFLCVLKYCLYHQVQYIRFCYFLIKFLIILVLYAVSTLIMNPEMQVSLSIQLVSVSMVIKESYDSVFRFRILKCL